MHRCSIFIKKRHNAVIIQTRAWPRFLIKYWICIFSHVSDSSKHAFMQVAVIWKILIQDNRCAGKNDSSNIFQNIFENTQKLLDLAIFKIFGKHTMNHLKKENIALIGCKWKYFYCSWKNCILIQQILVQMIITLA